MTSLQMQRLRLVCISLSVLKCFQRKTRNQKV